MACCGGGGSKRTVRSASAVSAQTAPKSKTPVVRKITRQRNATTPASIQRQYVIPRVACPKCGHPTMLVHIAGRERQQCTNIDCRFVIQ